MVGLAIEQGFRAVHRSETQQIARRGRGQYAGGGVGHDALAQPAVCGRAILAGLRKTFQALLSAHLAEDALVSANPFATC